MRDRPSSAAESSNDAAILFCVCIVRKMNKRTTATGGDRLTVSPKDVDKETPNGEGNKIEPNGIKRTNRLCAKRWVSQIPSKKGGLEAIGNDVRVFSMECSFLVGIHDRIGYSNAFCWRSTQHYSRHRGGNSEHRLLTAGSPVLASRSRMKHAAPFSTRTALFGVLAVRAPTPL